MQKRSFAIPFLGTCTILLFALLAFSADFTAAQTSTNPLQLKSNVTCANNVPSITLSWLSYNSAKSYTLYRNPNAKGTAVWYAVSTANMLSYTDTNVKLGTTYKYQVKASPTSGDRYSDVVTLTKIACPSVVATTTPPVVATTTPPAATTTAPTTTKTTFSPTIGTTCSPTPRVNLSWNNPNSASLFSLWRNPNATGAVSWGVIGTSTTTSYADTKVTTGKSYQYQISATASGSTRYSDILNSGVLNCTTTTATTTATSTPPTATTTPPATTPPPPTATTTTATSTSTTKKLKWGVYSGWLDGDIKQFQTIVGETPDMMAAFVHWGNTNTFPTYMAQYAKDKGGTLVIFWEASNYLLTTNDQPAYSYDAIIRGDWDAYIKKFAAEAKAYGGPVILIPFSEVNGNWSPWSGTLNGNTPAKAVLGFQHVKTVFGTVPNVKFGWAPNSNSVPNTTANAIQNYYPGDAYVDYVGVDGFNFDAPWVTFDQIFKSPLATISAYNKPMYVFSFASAQGTQKAAWITDALTVQMKKYPLLEGWVWFNQNKEKNWLIWSDDASLSAFKSAVQSALYN